MRVLTNSIKILYAYRFAKILLQFPQCSLFSKSPFFLIIRSLSRTWQPKTKSLNLSRTIIDSFSFRRPHYLRSENSTQLGAWVGGVTERLWLGCRPNVVFLWVPATVSGGRSLLRRRDKSLETQFWGSHLHFFNFSETSWASFWELRGRQQQKIKLSMRTVHFRIVFKVYVEVSPEWFFLVNRGNHQLMQWGRATELNFFARTHLLRKRISWKFCWKAQIILVFRSLWKTSSDFLQGYRSTRNHCKNAMGAAREQ